VQQDGINTALNIIDWGRAAQTIKPVTWRKFLD